MQNIKFTIDGNHEGTVFTVRTEASHLDASLVFQLSSWALSMEMGIDLEDLDSAEWDVSRPEEDDMGVWYTQYSREL